MIDDGGKTKIFAGTSDGIYLSTNSGTSWSDASAGLRVRDVKSIVIDSMDMYAGTDGGGVYLSTDRGKTWTAINNGSVDTAVLSIAVKGKDLYAGTKGGIYHSTDKGTNWTLIDWNYVWNRSLMLSGPHLLDGTGSTGIKLYADNGLGWNNFYSYLPSSDVRALVSSDKNIFAGIFADTGPYSSGPNSGVYLSTNNGLNWIKFNEGLDKTDVTALAVSGAYLYAGIAYQGVWRRSLSPMITSVETESISLPAKLQLAQNYPNPFNPTTNISYSIPTESRVELKVFDLLGREIATLISKDQGAGKYRVLFNGSSLPTGIYIYTLQAGQFRDSKKFLLLK